MRGMLRQVGHALLEGSLTVRHLTIPKPVIVGLVGVILMYVSIAGTYSVVAPWMLRGDSRQHLDYIWRLYHDHQLPAWRDGIRYQPFIAIGWGNIHQSAAANPPLFYLMQAPIVGPLLASGRWQQAVAVGRSLNILIGVVAALALAWAGWLYGGQRRALFAIAVPALAMLTYNIARLNFDYAIDALLLVLATGSLIMNYKLLTTGPQRRYIVAIALLSVLGMATKAPYLLFLLLNLLAIVLAYAWRSRDWLRAALKGAAVAAVIALFVVLAIGWFYYFHNYKTSGTWYSISPPGYTGGRVYQSLRAVLHDSRLWGLLYTSYAANTVLSAVVSTFAVAGWLLVAGKKQLLDVLGDRRRVALYGLLALTVLGSFTIQLKFAVGYGAINFRYMIPALLPISLFLAYGLLQFANLRGLLVAAAAVALGLSSFAALEGGHLSLMLAAVRANGLPGAVLITFLALFVIGSALLTAGLFRLTASATTTRIAGNSPAA